MPKALSAMNSLLCMRCCTREKSPTRLKMRPSCELRAPVSGLNMRISTLGTKASRITCASRPVLCRSSSSTRTRTHVLRRPPRFAAAAACSRRHGWRSTANPASSAQIPPTPAAAVGRLCAAEQHESRRVASFGGSLLLLHHAGQRRAGRVGQRAAYGRSTFSGKPAQPVGAMPMPIAVSSEKSRTTGIRWALVKS